MAVARRARDRSARRPRAVLRGAASSWSRSPARSCSTASAPSPRRIGGRAGSRLGRGARPRRRRAQIAAGRRARPREPAPGHPVREPPDSRSPRRARVGHPPRVLARRPAGPVPGRRGASELPSPPKGLQAAVVTRVKLIAELDIAERRVPQDGRVRVRLEERELDLRVSTVPTLYGGVGRPAAARSRWPARVAGRAGHGPGGRSRRFAAWPRTRTASCSPPGPPGAARPRRSTPRSACANAPPRRSSPSKTRSNTSWTASPRSPSNARPG